MGRVWQARDSMLQRDVAIKEIVPPPGLTDEARQELRTRSLREAQAIARLDHRNAIRVFDVLLGDGGDPWIVMEYVPSRSLSEQLAADGPVSPIRAAEIGLAVLGALQAAHRVGIVHRDVKPANILIGVDGRVVLTDFGLATAVEDTSLTQTGIVLGSPAYVAPERVMSGTVGPQGDLWSLGATLFAAVEGRGPYTRASSLMSLTALATEPPPEATHAGPLAPVIEGLLTKDPAERMAAGLAERLLRQVVEAASTAATSPQVGLSAQAQPTADTAQLTAAAPPPGRTRPRPRATWLVGGLAVALLAVGGGIGVRLLDDRSVDSAADLTELDGGLGPASSGAADPTPSGVAALPITWSTYRDESGFSIPAPREWQIVRDGGRVEFREPNGERRLVVGQTDEPPADPMADLAAQEKDLPADGRYPGYRRIRMIAVNYQQSAADWEWVHSDAGRQTRVRQRTFVTSRQQAYTIVWSTPEASWAGSEDAFRTIVDGFRPASEPQSATPSSPAAASPSPAAATPSAPASSAPPVSAGDQIVSVASGRCLDIGDPDSAATLQVRIMDCDAARDRSQRWIFGPDGTVLSSGRCLDVANASTGDGAVIQLTACNGGPAQRFTLNSERQLVNALSGKCLDVTDWGTGNGTPIQQWTCNNGADHQKWTRG
ncbi:serine/threonine protein kinase [Micromonospora sp. NBC_01813]|uniref:serine/threonine protein kinase n=1 Tax=Micromonospora sp. NBC_01813 TaxID=2975988 RepID=UPI003FA3644C